MRSPLLGGGSSESGRRHGSCFLTPQDLSIGHLHLSGGRPSSSGALYVPRSLNRVEDALGPFGRR
jgi:hypothetical protein